MQGTQAYKKDEPVGVPSLVMSIEHYGRIARLMERDVPVELELDVKTKFYDDDPMAYNTVAEIPGTDKKDEIVMLGGHLDSWHTGTGATDNACGVAVAMEAVRILKSLGVKPRRTIRIALWSGEEEGLLGSRAYVAQHIGERQRPANAKRRPRPTLPSYMRPRNRAGGDQGGVGQGVGVLQPRQRVGKNPRHLHPGKRVGAADLRERGWNPSATWARPRSPCARPAAPITCPSTRVGVPGFQFIQDPLEYDVADAITPTWTFTSARRKMT